MVTGSSGVVLLATKVLVSAGCVLAGATAAVRLGPRLGGPVASVRQLAVVSLVFFMIEPGPAFASQTAFWEHPGDVRDRPVFLGYLAATRMVPTPRPTSICAGVGLGAASFVLAAAVFGAIPLIRGLVVRFAAAVSGGAGWLVRGLPDRARVKRDADLGRPARHARRGVGAHRGYGNLARRVARPQVVRAGHRLSREQSAGDGHPARSLRTGCHPAVRHELSACASSISSRGWAWLARDSSRRSCRGTSPMSSTS